MRSPAIVYASRLAYCANRSPDFVVQYMLESRCVTAALIDSDSDANSTQHHLPFEGTLGDPIVNGAESLVRALLNADVDVCFANPGTSEMHFVAALDQVEGMRCILGLFEGVVTGAADGYARMSNKPAVTLLHTGPGLANGLANLHNARKAGVPIVNLVGEHATWHITHDAPLTSDIEGLARPMSHWLRTSYSAESVADDGLAAVAAAGGLPGNIATLILPANVAWEPVESSEAMVLTNADDAVQPHPAALEQVDADTIASVSNILQNNHSVALILGGAALRGEALESAARVAEITGATLFSETFKTRMERGVGRVPVNNIPYQLQDAVALLEPYEQIVTIGAKPPVAFFAYPGTRSELFSETAQVHILAALHQDVPHALKSLENAVGASGAEFKRQERALPDRCEDGAITPESLANVIARLLPENAIVVDESITSGRDIYSATQGAAPHDLLQVCGGSIGGGFPLATGAAVAAPDRRVISLEGDGSAMYTLQALWTQARESLKITSIVMANQSYDILKYELDNVQASSGDTALSMMDLDNPTLDWVSLAKGMGVPACKVETVAELEKALKQGLTESGPYLIEARI